MKAVLNKRQEERQPEQYRRTHMTMTWKQLAEKIAQLTEDEQNQEVVAVVLGDVVSAPFSDLLVTGGEKGDIFSKKTVALFE